MAALGVGRRSGDNAEHEGAVSRIIAEWVCAGLGQTFMNAVMNRWVLITGLYFLYLETFKATDPLDELYLDERMLFKWILPNKSVMLCSGPM